MKNKAERLPTFLRESRCSANPVGGHEPLMNESYLDEPLPVGLPVGNYLGVWDDGALEIRVCKHCQLLYVIPVKH